MPAGAWTLCCHMRLADIAGGAAFQAMFGFDDGGAASAQFYFERGDERSRWLVRDGGGTSQGNVQEPVTTAWIFLAARWDGGAGTVRFAWRELSQPSLTHVASPRPGFAPSSLLLFEDVFWAVTEAGEAVGLRWWNADLSDAELESESRQLAPLRWGSLGEWYRLRNAATAARSYSGTAPLTVSGTLATANDPPLPISYGAA